MLVKMPSLRLSHPPLRAMISASAPGDMIYVGYRADKLDCYIELRGCFTVAEPIALDALVEFDADGLVWGKKG